MTFLQVDDQFLLESLVGRRYHCRTRVFCHCLGAAYPLDAVVQHLDQVFSIVDITTRILRDKLVVIGSAEQIWCPLIVAIVTIDFIGISNTVAIGVLEPVWVSSDA